MRARTFGLGALVLITSACAQYGRVSGQACSEENPCGPGYRCLAPAFLDTVTGDCEDGGERVCVAPCHEDADCAWVYEGASCGAPSGLEYTTCLGEERRYCSFVPGRL